MIAVENRPLVVPTCGKPGGDSLLRALQHSELFRDFRGAFESVTGLPLELKRSDSFRFPFDGAQRPNPFCALMASRNRSCAACLQLQQRLHDDAAQGPMTLECIAGLSESAVPVRVGDSVVGLLRTGQAFLAKPSRKRFLEALGQLGVEEGSADAIRLEAAYFQTRILSRSQYDAALSLLSIFARHLGVLANRLLIEQANAELPVISKAKTYIQQNLSEPIRLDDVARASNTSAFYFCKLFARATGMTFTQYLARVRVEAVKQSLMNPNTRVCEAAYAVGFQSLSQFNRVFRRVAGETPSAYRDHAQAEMVTGRRAP